MGAIPGGGVAVSVPAGTTFQWTGENRGDPVVDIKVETDPNDYGLQDYTWQTPERPPTKSVATAQNLERWWLDRMKSEVTP